MIPKDIYTYIYIIIFVLVVMLIMLTITIFSIMKVKKQNDIKLMKNKVVDEDEYEEFKKWLKEKDKKEKAAK